MRRTRPILAALALALVAAPALAQQSSPPPPGPARPPNLPKIIERTLSNGLLVVVAPLPNVPKVTAVLTFRSATSAADRAAHPGIAQIAAASASEGTATRTSRQIKAELRSIGGSLSLGAGDDGTTATASSLAENAPQLFDLMSDVVRNPAYPDAEVGIAKDNAIQAIRAGRADPATLANERFVREVFGDHPYGFALTDEKAVAALTADDLKRFAAAHYVPNDAHIVVVGDVDAETVFGQVEKAFGAWKSGALPAESAPAPPAHDRRQIYFVDRPGSVQSAIYIGNVAIPRKDADYFALRTANVIFGGSFYSRLTKNIREAKGYTYSPFSSANTQAISGSFVTGAFVRNEVTGPTLLEMFYELDRMRVAPVTDEELRAAKEYSIGNFSVELAGQAGLAFRINSIYTYGLSRSFIADFGPKIEALTPDDIQRAARKYFDTNHAVVVVVGDYAKVKDQLAPFGDVTLYDASGNLVKR
jgi:zinc protease